MTEHEIIEWQDPPPKTVGKPGTWDAVRAELRAHRGNWSLIGRDLTYQQASGRATAISKRYPDIEATVRRTGETAGVWARAVEIDR